MRWKDKDLETIGDLNTAVSEIAKADDQEEADRFMEVYRAETPHAYANVGYLSGYYGPAMMAKIQRLFRTSHPIFGTRTDVSAEEAFDAGRKIAGGDPGE